MTIFACIYVPNFPVEAWLRAEPALRSQPVAVLEGKAPLQKVFAVNEKGAQAGLEAGMTRAQAELCPGAALRSRSQGQEAYAHSALLDCAQSFSPRVEDRACDTVLLDLAGLEPLFGPPARLAREMARRASDLGLETHVAVASSTEAAVLAARGFSGITVIPPGKEAEHLENLPVEVLFAGMDTESEPEASRLLETFARWGVRNLRALAALPEMALSERLGQQGLRLQKQARGAESRALSPVEPPLVFEEAIELEDAVVLLEPLAFLLQHLLEQICSRLASRSLATQELRLCLELDPACQPSENGAAPGSSAPAVPRCFRRALRLPVPMLDARTFLKLLQLDLKAYPPGAPILKIHLSAEPVRLRPAQASLFLPPAPEPEKLELTLARIAGVVGEGRAGSLELLDTHRPENFRLRHFTVGETRRESSGPRWEPRSGGNGPLPAGGPSSVTAVRMLRPPLPASIRLCEGRPARIACARRREIQGVILWAAGPWRSSGDWWEREEWAREEWDIAVQVQQGVALYRLVRDLLRGAWFVEGCYD